MSNDQNTIEILLVEIENGLLILVQSFKSYYYIDYALNMTSFTLHRHPML